VPSASAPTRTMRKARVLDSTGRSMKNRENMIDASSLPVG
jgi:hypothetical protein